MHSVGGPEEMHTLATGAWVLCPGGLPPTGDNPLAQPGVRGLEIGRELRGDGTAIYVLFADGANHLVRGTGPRDVGTATFVQIAPLDGHLLVDMNVSWGGPDQPDEGAILTVFDEPRKLLLGLRDPLRFAPAEP